VTARIPPRLATWVLDRLGMRYRSESLAGDLFEEYQQGRSPAWYWKQVIAAVFAARTHSIKVNLRLLLLKMSGYILAELGIVLLCSQIAESGARSGQDLFSPANIAIMTLLGSIAAIGVGIVIWVKRQARLSSPN
jgi:hypothetical protein